MRLPTPLRRCLLGAPVAHPARYKDPATAHVHWTALPLHGEAHCPHAASHAKAERVVADRERQVKAPQAGHPHMHPIARCHHPGDGAREIPRPGDGPREVAKAAVEQAAGGGHVPGGDIPPVGNTPLISAVLQPLLGGDPVAARDPVRAALAPPVVSACRVPTHGGLSPRAGPPAEVLL